MIKCKTSKGGTKVCQVVSKTTGKALSKANLSPKAAVKRLHQVEYFKNKAK